MEKFKRNIRPNLEKALLRSPVVLLTGARQTGKTTLIKEIGKEKGYNYVTFDDIRVLSAAKADPIGFISNLPKPIILDEVQRVPEIFLAIKQDVDEQRHPGRYALTGSANPFLIPRLGDSLAGRMEVLELFPLSQGELNNSVEVFLERAFRGEPFHSGQPLGKNILHERIVRGGYPLVQGLDTEGRQAWFDSYVTAILQRDIQDLAHISGLSELPLILSILATRVGTLLNTADLARSSAIPATTLHRYLALLKAVFLVDFLPAWSTNIGKRLVKSPKIGLVDSGLAAFLTRAEPEHIFLDARLMGGVLENFVRSELEKQATWSSLRVKCFHFRTTTGVEVDIVVENAEGQLVGIEVKSSDTVKSSDFSGLRTLQELTGKKFVKGFVLYTGSSFVPFGDKLFALPISMLWSA